MSQKFRFRRHSLRQILTTERHFIHIILSRNRWIVPGYTFQPHKTQLPHKIAIKRVCVCVCMVWFSLPAYQLSHPNTLSGVTQGKASAFFLRKKCNKKKHYVWKTRRGKQHHLSPVSFQRDLQAHKKCTIPRLVDGVWAKRSLARHFETSFCNPWNLVTTWVGAILLGQLKMMNCTFLNYSIVFSKDDWVKFWSVVQKLW